MKARALAPALAVALLGVASAAGAAPNLSPPEPGTDLLGRIERYVGHELANTTIPGGALVVVLDGHVALLKGFGVRNLRDRRPVTPDTVFQVGSLTKAITATAILQLRDRGLVALDAPVSRYVPWFHVADPKLTQAITLRTLLTQTSGLDEDADGLAWPYKNGHETTLEEAVRALGPFKLKHQPGSHFEYVNLNYSILGLVVQAVSHEPYAAYIQAHVLAPLEMGHSTFDRRLAARQDHAALHSLAFTLPMELPYKTLNGDAWVAPAGMLLSSARDMGHYVVAQLGAGPVALLPAQELVEAHAGRVKTRRGARRYGYGWYHETFHGSELVWHNGTTAGAFSTLQLLPGRHDGVLLLTNATDSRVDAIGRGVIDLIAHREPAHIGPKRNELSFWEHGLGAYLWAAYLVLSAL